jgi:hypothetical protein
VIYPFLETNGKKRTGETLVLKPGFFLVRFNFGFIREIPLFMSGDSPVQDPVLL